MLIWACAPDSSVDPELVAKAEKIHNSVITLDTHVDINTGNFTEEKNYTMNLDTQVDLPKMEAGGLDVAFLIVYTGQGELDQEGFDAAYENAVSKFDAIHRLTEELAPDQIELALTSDDVRRIHAAGKKVAMIGVENAYPLGMELDRVKEFFDRGARYMSLSHNGHSQLSDSNTGEIDDVWLHNGLSDFGKEVIAEMNKWGIMIDLSHPSKKANMQTMELSKAPVIASHSSARALDPSVSRNLDDEELMMLKENGGVVQTVAFRSYVNSEKHEAYREAASKIEEEVAEEMGFEMVSRDSIRQMSTETRNEYFALYQEMQKQAQPRIEQETAGKAPSVDVSDFVDHIDYMVDLIGVEHVGISSDFDGGGGVNGWMDASETLNVTIELVKRGYTQEQIEMIWSGNLLRVLDEVQKVAAEIQAEG
ncbi:MAG: dipeptidase [Balneola sp.]|nr:dipeptidase [Balneola sp.]MBO6649749.1 dipeptidase [Balneola sp.]MBO6712312.1 dipeptidase [Balneola sp.]MBO6800506.1 dipeptidase [Balneola sp.]MBO6871460.1 dipeptidase [Balneola sp.]